MEFVSLLSKKPLANGLTLDNPIRFVYRDWQRQTLQILIEPEWAIKQGMEPNTIVDVLCADDNKTIRVILEDKGTKIKRGKRSAYSRIEIPFPPNLEKVEYKIDSLQLIKYGFEFKIVKSEPK